MNENLDKAIGYCMHALKQADPTHRADLQRAMAYVNATRILYKAGDEGLASACIAKCVEVLASLSPMEEGVIPADRMARATSTSTTVQQRDEWMGSARRRESSFNPSGSEPHAAAPTVPPAPAAKQPGTNHLVANRPAPKVFGKRRT